MNWRICRHEYVAVKMINTLSIAAVCLAAVLVGPSVMLADVAGVAIVWPSVPQALVVMLVGLVCAHVVTILHLVFVSRLPKAQKWDWIHSLSIGLHPFASFEYLFGGGATVSPRSRRNARRGRQA